MLYYDAVHGAAGIETNGTLKNFYDIMYRCRKSKKGLLQIKIFREYLNASMVMLSLHTDFIHPAT